MIKIQEEFAVEFNEKLQELRKRKGLTQEELAETLFVSRTAVSKWESGRGYPSIDSLKDISKFFSVTIDDLLSSEIILSIAEKENKKNISGICNLIFGIVDLFSVLLIILPIYPDVVDGYVFSVSLFDYTQLALIYRIIYWLIFVLLIFIGIVKLILTKFESERLGSVLISFSVFLNIFIVLFLALKREVYALVISFLMLVVKGVIILKQTQSGNQKY